MHTVMLTLQVECRVPDGLPVDGYQMGIAGAKVLNRWQLVKDAEILTWHVAQVVPLSSRYVTCPRCNKIELVTNDCAVLDGKVLCVICTGYLEASLSPARDKQKCKFETAPVSSKKKQ